jgi:low temperature requirement protein LtrA
MYGPDQAGLLRARDGGEQQVTSSELFFDLVFVFAVTQLSHRLLDEPIVVSTLETLLLLLLVVWSAWVTTTWVTNWFDANGLSMRLMLVTVMLASLLMSVAIPEAFGERGLMFALAYVTIQVGRAARRPATCRAGPARAGSRRNRPFRARGSAAHPGSAGWHAPPPRRPASRTPVRSPRHGSSGPPPPSPGP